MLPVPAVAHAGIGGNISFCNLSFAILKIEEYNITNQNDPCESCKHDRNAARQMGQETADQEKTNQSCGAIRGDERMV